MLEHTLPGVGVNDDTPSGPLNAQEVLGRKVGLPGLAVGTIIAAGWSYKVRVIRLDCDGTAYNALVSGYLVRWPSGEVSLLPLDRLKRSNLLPVEVAA